MISLQNIHGIVTKEKVGDISVQRHLKLFEFIFLSKDYIVGTFPR